MALLRETEEAARNVRNASWLGIAANGTYHPQTSGNVWTLAPGQEVVGQFTRELVISSVQRDDTGKIVASAGTVDPSTKQVVSTVSWNTPISSSISSVNYLERYRGNTAWSQTSQADFNAGIKTDTQVLNNSGGEIQLIQASSTTDYGNKFRTTATSSIGNMTSINHKTSLRFTAQNSKTVNAIRVYIQAESGTSPSYRFGIQSNSGTNPSGVFLSSGIQTNTSTGWKTIPLSTPVSLTAGSVYHIVIEPVGTPTGSANIALRRSTPLNSIYPQTQAIDTQANTLFKTSAAGAWTTQNFQPIYELDYSDSTYEGNPYDTNTEVSIFGSNWVGEKFTVTGTNKTASSISFCVIKVGTPGGNLTVELRDGSNTTIYSAVLTTVAATPTSYTCPGTWQTHTFPSPITLMSTSTYRIFLRTTGGNNNNSYRLQRLDTINSSNYNSINYDGLNSVYTNTTSPGSTWTDTNNSDLSSFFFTVTSSNNYPTSGTFESQTFNATSQVAFNHLTFSINEPANTNVIFQVAINSDNSTWNYFGSFESPAAIPLANISGQYLRVRATLSGDGTATPTVSDFSVNYSP